MDWKDFEAIDREAARHLEAEFPVSAGPERGNWQAGRATRAQRKGTAQAIPSAVSLRARKANRDLPKALLEKRVRQGRQRELV